MAHQPYNPLDKTHLGESVVRALLARPVMMLPPHKSFVGAGLYALYYTGDVAVYRPITEKNRPNAWALPIYVGKTVPPGARKGGYGLGESPGEVLYRRLREHATSIQQANNLSLDDFRRFPRIILPYGAGCVVSSKAEPKAPSNARELRRQRRGWANRQARRVHSLPEIALGVGISL